MLSASQHPHYRTILRLALPIMGGMLSQSLLNLVDAAMVGTLGEQPLAAVGIGGYANFLVVALILGLSAGVQAMVARRHGEGRLDEKAAPLNGGLLLALLTTLPLTALVLAFSDRIVGLLAPDAAVLAIADDYFRLRALALAPVGMSICFRGYWNGINQPMTYLKVLVSIHVLNVIISYGLIFGKFGLPAMGAAGAGLGTTLAVGAGALMLAVITWRHARDRGFLQALPDGDTLRSMVQLSLPNSIQQFLFAASVSTLLWIIGQIGTRELAVAHVLIHLSLLLILPAVGLGMAATTLVSHAMGEGNYAKATRIGWDVCKVAFLILVILSLPLWLMPEAILGLFLHQPELVALGSVPLQIGATAICADTIAIVFTQALLGAGANRLVMGVTTLGQWFFYLPLAWIFGPLAGGGLVAIWLVQLLHRAASSGIFAWLWWRQRWIHIKM